LTQDEVVEGLKEALRVGTDTATTRLMKTDGYYKNPDPLVFIPWPQEAQQAKMFYEDYGNYISDLTGGQLLSTDDIIERFNRAAEDAATDAAPIFFNAITDISISDGLGILQGADTAATHYLRVNTFNELRELYTPTVRNSMEKIQVQQVWQTMASNYNQAVNIINNTPFASTIYPDAIVGLSPVNDDISEYVVTEALDGLFIEVGKREGEIRNNAVARVTDILERVFGQNN
ncbi:MAG: DUF4197 domain-containing protein, partial [Bacteroidota bacterium]